MTYGKIITVLLIAAWIYLFFGMWHVTSDERKRLIAVTGQNVTALETAKSDCEKKLPRDKECVMVFYFIPVEADYE